MKNADWLKSKWGRVGSARQGCLVFIDPINIGTTVRRLVDIEWRSCGADFQRENNEEFAASFGEVFCGDGTLVGFDDAATNCQPKSGAFFAGGGLHGECTEVFEEF